MQKNSSSQKDFEKTGEIKRRKKSQGKINL